MNEANNFFTLQSLATFGGATLAITVIGNTFRSLTGKDPKIVSFISSIVVCIALAWSSIQQTAGYLIVLLNGCLVYCTAMGLTNQVAKSTATPGAQQTRGQVTRSVKKRVNQFFRPW
jgi:hypothetical protein